MNIFILIPSRPRWCDLLTHHHHQKTIKHFHFSTIIIMSVVSCYWESLTCLMLFSSYSSHCIICSFFFSFSHFFSSGRKWRWPRYAIVPRSLDEQRQHIESLLGETSSFGSLLEEKSPGASSSSISSFIMRWLPFWVFCRTSSPCTPHALSTRSVRHINLMTSWILMKWIEKDQPTAVGVAYRLITST